MRWISQLILVRNAVKCGELFFFHRFHRISDISLPKKMKRWIFVRNAVNFCKKCGKMRWNIYCHRIHHNHRISYKISPHSPHFLQKFTQKPRPGQFPYSFLWSKIESIYRFLLFTASFLTVTKCVFKDILNCLKWSIILMIFVQFSRSPSLTSENLVEIQKNSK